MHSAEVRVVRHATGESFLARAEPWLLLDEAENNLILGLARQIALYISAHGVPYLATVEQDGAIIGCAFRTPPWKLIMTRMPERAVVALVEDVATQYDVLPAALAPVETAREFGVRWSNLRGARQCFLHTDLANTTSNSIYTQIGYEPIADAIDIHFAV